MHKYPQLEVKNLTIAYNKGSNIFHAVSDVSFEIFEGETVAIVGESGCGKSSIAKAILGLANLNSGSVFYNNTNISKDRKKTKLHIKRDIQMIFQDPYSSLNPRMTIEEIIKEPLVVYKIGTKKEQKKRVEELLKSVKLPMEYRWRYPHELSGGERQRVSIARALASKPKLLVCDEPTHALDMSVQASIINLLKDLRDEHNLSLLFISHDLSLVKNISDRCLVMYGGKFVETGSTEDVFAHAVHPFTQNLLAAVPIFEMKAPLFLNTNTEKDLHHETKVTVESRLLHSYVMDLQESISTVTKKSYQTAAAEGRCPYINKCKNKQSICETNDILAKPITEGHSTLCHFAKKV